jgi:heptosyltransferase-2
MSGLSAGAARIVVLHAGGIGDLVLAESLFAALRERNPFARLELLCRQEAAPIAGLYAHPPDAIHAFPFDPYRWDVPSDLIAAEIRALAAIVGPGVDVFISAELQSTYLSDVLAAVLASPEAAIGDTSGSGVPFEAFMLMRKLDVVPNRSLRRLAPSGSDEHELDRYARLAGVPSRRLPALRRFEPALNERPWIAMFPLASKPIQRWPLERTVDVGTRIADRHGASIRLVGSAAQRPDLENVARMFRVVPEVVTGTPADLPDVAGELSTAFGYVGLDTGLVHIAAAYGVPGVAIFGGGHWPAYAPWQSNSVAVLSPIPCFHCNWDCAFERAFCLDGVDANAVADAFDAVAGGRTNIAPVEIDAFSPRERAMFEGGALAYRKAHADRVGRLAVTTRLRDIVHRWSARAGANRNKAQAGLTRLEGATRSAIELLERLKGNS